MTACRAILVLALMFFTSAPALAFEPDEVLKDPKLEARARVLSAELRCLVCQNQSIDDSSAPLARDLRLLIRERLTAGDTNIQAMDFVVARYGEFVLLRPRFGTHTLLLWLGPVAILLLGGLGVAVFLRRHRGAKEDATSPPLSAEESGRLAELLVDDKTR